MQSVPCNFHLQIKVLPYGDYTGSVCFLYYIVLLSTSGDSSLFSPEPSSSFFFPHKQFFGIRSFFHLPPPYSRVSRFLRMLITISYIHFPGSFYNALTVKIGSSRQSSQHRGPQNQLRRSTLRFTFNVSQDDLFSNGW